MAHKAAPKLPRLRMREELLKSAPELARLLGEDVDGEQGVLFEQSNKSGTSNRGPGYSVQTVKGGGSHAVSPDNPALAAEEELTEEDELRIELEAVKRERSHLMASLAEIKTQSGKAGGELQQEDVRRLRKEVELKMEKLNEIRKEARRHESQIARLSLTSKDCTNLMPGEPPDDQARIKALTEESKVLEEELIEVEAKNRLYTLLGERTRREHMAMSIKVQEGREMQENYLEDETVLTSYMHDIRAAREDADRELAHMRKMAEDAHRDWTRKLKDRRKEVYDMERRQAAAQEREARKAARVALKERQERERNTKLKMEEEAYEMQLQAVQPKLEAMEAAWYRLHSISGAATPDQVIAYWEGLRSKEENMRELVRLAEVREAQAKEQMTGLLDNRSNMFQSQNAASEADADLGGIETHIEEAQRTKALAKKKFNKARSVCIGAHQGLKSLMNRLEIALLDASQQRGLSRSSSRRTSRDAAGRQLSRNSSTRRRSMASPTNSLKQSREGFEANLAAERSVLPAEASGTATVTLDGLGNTIDDAEFFPDLPGLVNGVADRLTRLMDLDKRLISALHKVDENEPATGYQTPTSPPKSELALQKGFRRRTWTGPAWLDNVTSTGHIMPPGATMKAKKGKKQDTIESDLAHILGYTGTDMDPVGPPSPVGSEKDTAAAGEPGSEWDGVLDRDYIKHRAMKIALKQANKGNVADGKAPAALAKPVAAT
ncbi:hypothetical protein WJX82_009274 [Trebouxia sp. C0006]